MELCCGRADTAVMVVVVIAARVVVCGLGSSLRCGASETMSGSLMTFLQ